MYNVYVYIYTVMLMNSSPKEAGYSKTPNKPSSTRDFGPRWSSNNPTQSRHYPLVLTNIAIENGPGNKHI